MSKLLRAAAVLALAGCVKHPEEVTEPAGLRTIAPDSLAPVYHMDNPDRIPDEYIIRFKPSVSNTADAAGGIVALHRGRALAVLGGLKALWAKLPTEAVQALRRDPRVRYIEANTIVYPATTYQTIACCGTDNWALDRIDQVDNPQDGVYAYDYDGAGVHVWILDTGVDTSAAELSGRIDFNNWSTYNGTNPFAPCFNHGTPVAILAAGTTYGVAKGATINVARVSDDCSLGSSSVGAVSSSLEFIADQSPRPAVANYSFASHCTGGFSCFFTVDDAVNYAVSEGVQVVVSAGNDGNDACSYSPARVANALTVGASNQFDQRVINAAPSGWSSNYGSCLDLFAPGIYLTTGQPGGFGGTSGAAPLVTGTAALYLQQYPSATPAAVRQNILANASQNSLLYTNGSPNLMLHTRPAVSAPSVSSAATSPSPAHRYQPFSLTVNGSSFSTSTVEILLVTAGCIPDYDACSTLWSNSQITSKTSTQLVIGSIVFGSTGDRDVYVRNGRNGLWSAYGPTISVVP